MHLYPKVCEACSSAADSEDAWCMSTELAGMDSMPKLGTYSSAKYACAGF